MAAPARTTFSCSSRPICSTSRSIDRRSSRPRRPGRLSWRASASASGNRRRSSSGCAKWIGSSARMASALSANVAMRDGGELWRWCGRSERRLLAPAYRLAAKDAAPSIAVAGRRQPSLMIHKDGDFAGHGGLRLHWQAWLPEGEVRAVLLVAHGYAEHSGRYGNLVEAMVPRGFALYALDHRGHGRSEGPRGHVGRFAEFIADLHALRVRAEEGQRGKPLVVLGHSMGGLIAIRYLLFHASGVAGAVLSSPALGILNEPARALRWVARILSWIAPRTSFQSNVEPEFLSRDPAVGRAYADDPLVHRRASVR